MICPVCQMRTEVDDLRAKHEADRIALGKCWIDGGMMNLKPTPTVIRIDAPISNDNRRELLYLLKKIEMEHDKKEASGGD